MPPPGNSPNVTDPLERGTHRLSARGYALALTAPLVWNAVCPGQRPHHTCERDPWAPGGNRYRAGYADVWSTPDKNIHLLASAALVLAGERAGLSPEQSAGLTLGAGVALEYTQGYVSRRDIAADAAGVLAAYLWIRYVRSTGPRILAFVRSAR